MRGGASEMHDSLVAKSIFMLANLQIQAQNEHYLYFAISINIA